MSVEDGHHGGYANGRSHVWTAEAIRDIQAKADLGRYQIRGFSTFHRFPTLDDLVFLPAVMTRLPLEGYRESCDTKTVIGGGRPDLVARPLQLDIPIYLSSMSFGALGTNAKMALGRGFSKAGSATCTGEGGMLPEEREASDRLIYQMTPSRYGLDLEHLRMADAIEIAIGQGAKPGTGGMLLGMKVSEKVAQMRTLPVGVDQRSAARHPYFLGGDDLAGRSAPWPVPGTRRSAARPARTPATTRPRPRPVMLPLLPRRLDPVSRGRLRCRSRCAPRRAPGRT
jgi:methylamine---glutamate N-methyltransferase subunit C